MMTDQEVKDLKSTAIDEGADYDLALKEASQFSRGDTRLPGTRDLDPW